MIDNSLLSLLVIVIILGVFGFFAVMSKRKTGIEKGLKPLYEERCSGNRRSFGLVIGGNIPFWRVSLYENFLILASVGKIVLHYNEIDSVEFSNRFFNKKIRICAVNSKIDIIIYPKNVKKIVSIFKEKNVAAFES